MLFVNNQKHSTSKRGEVEKQFYVWYRFSPWLRIKQCWLCGPHWPGEAREGPIHHPFFCNVTCKGQRFWGTTPLSGEYWFGYAWIGATFCSQARKRLGNRGENLAENWGEFRVKNSPFWLRKNRGQNSKDVREVFAAFFAEDFETSFAEVNARGFPNLRSTREAICALQQFSEDTKPEWLLWSKCSSPPKPLSRNTTWSE